MERPFLALIVCLLAAGAVRPVKAWPGPPKAPVLVDAGVNAENHARIHILFDEPVPKPAELPGKDAWLLYERTQESPTATPRMQKLEVDSLDMSELSTTSTLFLNLKQPVSDDVTWLELTISGDTYLLHQQVSFRSKHGPNKPTPYVASTSKSDSDLYFNGSFAATSGQSPVYNIDAFAGYMEGLQKGKKYYGELGAYGQVRTLQSAVLNPNSFQIYGVYQRLLTNSPHWYGAFQVPYLSYRFAGWEFDLGGQELNFITSPIVTIPFRLTGKQGVIRKGFSAPHIVVHLGTEFVDVQQSALARTGAWHTRGLIGASFDTGYKPDEPKKYLDSITLSSAYQVRLLSAPEIYYDPKFATINPLTGASVIPPMLGTQPRSFVDTKVCYNFVKWVGFTFESTYGSLPPSFNKTPATYNLGLSFTLKQTSFGRYSILRP